MKTGTGGCRAAPRTCLNQSCLQAVLLQSHASQFVLRDLATLVLKNSRATPGPEQARGGSARGPGWACLGPVWGLAREHCRLTASTVANAVWGTFHAVWGREHAVWGHILSSKQALSAPVDIGRVDTSQQVRNVSSILYWLTCKLPLIPYDLRVTPPRMAVGVG